MMKKEREIEALSLFLTAGTGAGALLAAHSPIYLHIWTHLACLLTAGGILALILTGRRALAWPLFFLTGLLGFLTAAMPPSDGGDWAFARMAGERFRQAIDAVPFPNDGTAPLLKAFLTGDRSSLPKATVSMFRRSGASHLLALSGLHIGIIYTLFARALSVFGNAPSVRLGRFLLTVPATLFFTLMTGASPSIVRAFLFITLNETARLTGRKRDPVKIFAVALLVQLVVTPGVITSVGFQLSYCAMLGILLFFPPMRKWYPETSRWNPVRRIWETAALSIACQLTTAPLAWFYFHTFPRYFLITNLLAIPLTTLVISLAIAAVTLWAAGWCPEVLIRTTDACARLLTGALEVISEMGGTT